MTLREAQEAKLDRVCRTLELGPDDHLLEIGTGWGSLALHAAGRYGCRVTTTTLSREQRAAARERVRGRGLGRPRRGVSSDYRELRGRYSKLASIEMIEAVGWQYFDTFFARCSSLLAPDGLMLLQAITIDDRAYEVEKAGAQLRERVDLPWRLPALARGDQALHARGPRGCACSTWRTSPAGYPETLRRWRENWLAAAEEAARLGYDERFPAALGLLLRLVGGRLPRAPHRGRAGAARRSRPTAGRARTSAARSRPPARPGRARRAWRARAGPPGPARDRRARSPRTTFAAHSSGLVSSQAAASMWRPYTSRVASSMSVSTPGVTRWRTLTPVPLELAPERLAEGHHAGLAAA